MSDQKSQGSRGQQDQRSLALWVTMEKVAYWTRRWERVPSVLSGERALTVMVVNPQGGVITSILWTQVLPDDFHLGNLYSKGQEEVKEVRDKVAYNEGKMESVSLYLVSRSINLFFFFVEKVLTCTGLFDVLLESISVGLTSGCTPESPGSLDPHPASQLACNGW